MRKVYRDPMQELNEIIRAGISELSHISVTKDEMRSLMRHLDAAAMFPTYFNELNSQLSQHNARLKDIKIQKNRPDIFEEERNKLFDREFEIESHVKKLQETVPNELMTKYGIAVKVSLR